MLYPDGQRATIRIQERIGTHSMLYPDVQRTELMRFAKNQKNNPTCIPHMKLRGYVRAPKFEIDLSESWQRNQWRVQSWLQSLSNFLCYYMLFFSHSLRTLVC